MFSLLQKAFDTLDGETIIIKLGKKGFRRTVLDVLRECLGGEYHFVSENGKQYKILCGKTGVSQSSVLGHFNFILYIVDLRKLVKHEESHIMMFADDATIVNSGTTTDWKIDEVLQRINDWFTPSNLTVIVDKCGAMFFG